MRRSGGSRAGSVNSEPELPAAGEEASRKGLDALVRACGALRRHGIFVFLSHRARFRNPLVPGDRAELLDADAARDPAVLSIVDSELPRRLARLERGTYFPVPLARAVAAGRGFDDALMSFHYPPILVDGDRRWSWKEQTVADRVRRFFVQHIGFEPALDIWYVEYRVNDGWWDKCYLECETTPLVAVQFRDDGAGARGLVTVDLSNGQRDALDPDSLRLDERERLFATSARHGPVEIADAPRFALLRTVSEDCLTLEFAGARRPLRWPSPDGG